MPSLTDVKKAADKKSKTAKKARRRPRPWDGSSKDKSELLDTRAGATKIEPEESSKLKSKKVTKTSNKFIKVADNDSVSEINESVAPPTLPKNIDESVIKISMANSSGRSLTPAHCLKAVRRFGAERAMYAIALIELCEENGHIRLGQAAIAEQLGVNIRSVKRILDALVNDRAIELISDFDAQTKAPRVYKHLEINTFTNP